MTAEQKKQHRMELLLEIEEAKSDYAHERDVLLRHASNLEIIVSWLRNSADGNPQSRPGDPDKLGDAILNVPKYKECLNFDLLRGLIDGLEKRRKHLDDLIDRLNNLTPPFGGVR